LDDESECVSKYEYDGTSIDELKQKLNKNVFSFSFSFFFIITYKIKNKYIRIK